MAPRGRLPLAFLAALILLPVALAQPSGPATPASFLVYHALGGPVADPEATPLAPPPPAATRLPATFFDGATRADPAPENAPERALAHYREFQRILQAREATGAPVRVTLDGAARPGTLHVEAELASNAVGSVNVSLVVFEHARSAYAARFALAPVALDLGDGAQRVAQEVRLDPAWDLERLGVVAIVRVGDEVVQSATWMPRHDAPRVQVEKAVLVEHVTASWCDPCKPADEALALLWTQRGVAGALLVDAEPAYLQRPSGALYTGLLLGALLAVAALRRSAA